MGMKEPKHEPIPSMPGVVSNGKTVSDVPPQQNLVSSMKSNEESTSSMPDNVLVKK